MDTDGRAIVVACDESGNDGENLFGGNATVFAHGSVAVSTEQGESLIAELRQRINSKSAELKSKELLKPKNLNAAQWLLRDSAVAAQSSVNLTEKRYFLTCKLFDSTVEEQMYARGLDIYKDDVALRTAMYLYAHAPNSFGSAWDDTLEVYNRLLRSNCEAEIESHLISLRAQLADLQGRCSGLLKEIIQMVWSGINYLPDLARQQAGLYGYDKLRTLDPVLAAIGQTARTWAERSGRDVIVVHDDAKVLTAETVASIKYHLAKAHLVARSMANGSVVVRDILQVDSKADSRVQLADLLAGIGRAVAEQALEGKGHPLRHDLQLKIDPLSMWGDVQSWKILNPD